MTQASSGRAGIRFASKTVHIVGLGFDPSDPHMGRGLAQTRGGRGQRARDMADQLARVGIQGAYEGALQWAGNPDLISRTHFARFLVERGVCSDTSDVFRHYLKEGKPGFVPHCWASLKDAVQWIVQAQGVAVIAHSIADDAVEVLTVTPKSGEDELAVRRDLQVGGTETFLRHAFGKDGEVLAQSELSVRAALVGGQADALFIREIDEWQRGMID